MSTPKLVPTSPSCSCDQTNWAMFDYIEQALLARDLPIQTIAYNTGNQLTHSILKRIALLSKSRFHCYSAADNREVYKVNYAATCGGQTAEGDNAKLPRTFFSFS